MKANIYKIAAGCMAGILLSMSATSQTIYTFCGTGIGGYSGDGGPATAATMRNPEGIRIHNGDLYFVESNTYVIRKVTGSTNIISTVVGTGLGGGYTGDGGPATAATIWGGLCDIVFDNSNNMYFSDQGNNCVRKVNSSGIISTIAGDGTSGSSGDGGAATAAKFYATTGLAFDAAGNLYIADHRNHKIRKVDMATGIVTTVAGTGTAGSTGDGGAATAADIEYPVGLAIDAANNLYFSEYETGVIRKINLTSGIISTHATGMEKLTFIQFDQAGNLFAGNDASVGRVYKITPSGTVTTVAGGAGSAPTGDGGPATAAGMEEPRGVAITSNGSLLISNRDNYRIRIVTPVIATISGTATVCAGGTTTFTASIPDAAWKSGNTAVATVSATGVVTGVSAGTATITYVAGLVFGTKVVTVNAPTTPVITAAGSTLSVPATYASYQWSLGGTPIAGATNATYNATTTGTYAVSVTDAGGCSATSANFSLSSVSVAAVGKATDVQLFPNPATGGSFTMNIPSAENEAVTIAVYNAMGQKVYETIAQTNKTLSMKLDVPAGMYLVKAVLSNANYHANVVVN